MKNNSSCVMVCVTPQECCTRLIEAGARAAKESGLELKVISVFKKDGCMNPQTSKILDKLSEFAGEYNADMNVYFNDEASLTVAVAATRAKATLLIMGFPKEGSSGFIRQIHELMPKVPITMVDEQCNEYKILPLDKSGLEIKSVH